MISLTAVQHAGDERETGATEALVYPTIGTLLATGAVASTVCRTPDQPFASWGALLARAVGYLLLAGCAHAAAVWTICRIYGDKRQATTQTVMRGMWPPAALLPVTVLLAHAGSAWAAVVLPAIALMAVMFVRRAVPGAGRIAHLPAPAGVAPGLFAYRAPDGLWRTLWPMAAVALMLELAAAMLASWQYALAGLLIGLCAAVVLWSSPLLVRAETDRANVRRARTPTAVALLLTIVALLPSLGGSRMAGTIGRFVGGAPVVAKIAPPPVHAGQARGGALSGVILTLPPKPRQKLVMPSPPSAVPTVGMTRPVQTIPFDGAYWYFRSLELRPREDAKRVRGDPMKVNIRSTDASALRMEAHQRLETPIEASCCSAIRVAVRNAEVRQGAIGLQLVLEANAARGGWRRELETVTLPSSLQPAGARGQAQNEETLTFALPGKLPASPIDELTVVVLLPAGERSRVGTHVAIEHFELVGR